MVISKNSQLGLMMDDLNVQVEFLTAIKDSIQETLKFVASLSDKLENATPDKDGSITFSIPDEFDDFDLPRYTTEDSTRDRINLKIGTDSGNFVDNDGARLYLICDGVEKCSKMIRIGDNFSSKALRNIKFGKHTYLLGKNEMCRFLCAQGAIKGVYWNREKKEAFEFGFDLENDGYYYIGNHGKQFNRIAKIITFVELGDIEVEILEKGRNNGKPKKSGKITNTSEFTVYVVDSSWNKLIIRTEGFAVMGHFRLQPCGTNHSDRKLIWIDAFEKHGYKRSPKAKIIHD